MEKRLGEWWAHLVFEIMLDRQVQIPYHVFSAATV